MLGGSSCCGSATGGAKNTKKKVVKPKKRVVKKIKGGNTGPETEPVPGTGGAKKTKKRVVKPKKLVKKYGKRKGGYTDVESEEDESQVGGAKKKKGSKVGVKRALSPYNKFVKKHFAEIKKKFPDEKAPQIMQKVAVEWNIFKNK